MQAGVDAEYPGYFNAEAWLYEPSWTIGLVIVRGLRCLESRVL